MSITDWPPGERPREKLLERGAQSLSDAELLAIFLRVGLPGKSAVDLARELLGHFGSLNALFSASRQDFTTINGMGDAKFSQLQAVMEMARRALAEQLRQADTLSNPNAVRDYLRLWLSGESREVFGALFLDTRHRVLAAEILFRGTVDKASVHPREVVKRGLMLNAAAIVVAHNHPSGDVSPSAADLSLTDRLHAALALVDVRLLDHFVVGRDRILSLAEQGWRPAQ